MKTKHILTAMALPAMFAACTADDIVSVNNGLQQAERAMLSENFVLSVNGEVESRYAVEGSTGLDFIFEVNDSIGANLIDQPKFAEGKLEEDPAKWTITEYVAPALPFVNDGEGVWKSAGRLGVGNYLYTNPYNPEDGGRLAAKFELPIVVQYDSENPNETIELYNKSISAGVNREGETQAHISLKNLYTYPKVRIHFDRDENVTKVTKVILKRSTQDAGFAYKGGLHHAAIAAIFYNETKWVEDYMEVEGVTKKEAEDAYWAQFETSDFIIDGKVMAGLKDANGNEVTDASADNAYGEYMTTPNYIYEMDEPVVSYANSKGIEVRLMLPSMADFTASDIVVIVCTDNGNYEFDLKAEKTGNKIENNDIVFGDLTFSNKIVKALTRSSSNTLNTKNLTYTADKSTAVVDNIVTTAKDWNNLVAKYDAKIYAADGEKDLIVTIPNNSEFALTSDLNMPKIAQFVIKSDVAVEGEVTLSNIKIDGAKLIVKKGANVTTSQTLVAPAVEVEEDAALNIDAAYDKNKELIAYTEIKTIKNEGTVTVLPGAEATFYLDNAKAGSKLYVGAEASRAATTVAVANLINNTVSANAIYPSENNGKVYNYGVINVDGTFVNYGPGEDTGYEKNKLTEEWTDRPVVYNEATFYVKGAAFNYSEFKNNDVLSSNFNLASFTNDKDGVLEVKAGASTYIDDNTNGTIILNEMNPVDFAIHNAKGKAGYTGGTGADGKVVYTLKKDEQAEVKMGTSPVTYLIANGDVKVVETFNYTDSDSKPVVKPLGTLEVNGGEVEVSKAKNTAETPAYKAQITNLVINSGKATIGSEMESVSNIKVMANASLTVLETAEVTLSGDYSFGPVGTDDKPGIMSVLGTFHMSAESKKTSDGKYLTQSTVNVLLGKDKYISCNKTTPTTTNYYEAVVEQWWKDIKGRADGYWDTYFGANPYDVKYLTKTLVAWGSETAVRNKEMYDGLMTELGLTTATDQTEEKIAEALISKHSSFASAVTKYVIYDGVEAAAGDDYTKIKNKYINATTGDIKSTDNIVRVANLYENQELAIRDLMAKMVDAKDFSNFQSTKEIFKVTVADMNAALNKTTYGQNQNGACAYIWKEETCPLYKVMNTAKAYSPADWALGWGKSSKDLFGSDNAVWGTEKAVNNWVKYASLVGGTTEKTLAATYYPASEKWDYSVNQIAACMGVDATTIKAKTDGGN